MSITPQKFKEFKNLVKNKDNFYPFKVTFDYRKEDNGYMLGMPRNYPTSKVEKLVNSIATQTWIGKGNAVIMYGHGARDHAKGSFVPKEHNPNNGEVQIPIGKITKLSMNKNKSKIDFEGIFFESKNNHAEDVIAMAKAGIGGFSFVWNVKDGIFYGADYVLVQNFSSNKVIMDSIDTLCSNGACDFNTTLDNILIDQNVPLALYKESKELLKHQREIQSVLDLKSKIQDLKMKFDSKSKYAQTLKDDLEEMKIENRELRASNKSLVMSAKDSGLRVEDDKVYIDGLDEIFRAKEFVPVDIDSVKESLKKRDKVALYPTFRISQ